MKILHLSPYVPDVRADHAGGVCMGKTVETLQKYHEVTVLTCCNDAHEEKMLRERPEFRYIRTSKAGFLAKVLLHLNMPNMFAIRRSRAFRKMICEIIEKEKIEAVHAEFTAMGQYAWIKRKYPGIRFNLAEHDVALQSFERMAADAGGLRKIYYSIEKRKVERAEGRYVRAADTVFTFNEKDKALLQQKYGIPAGKIRALNPYYGIELDGEPEESGKDRCFCFVGLMNRLENHEAAMRLVRIFREIPAAEAEGWKLTIIGAHPRPELQAAESERIHITGFVDDINKEIGKAQFAVFPLIHGAGIKLKVLLAFGLGLPVVTGQVGAEGIDPDGEVIRLAETDEDFKREILRLMHDDAGRKELSRQSRAYVRDHFNWQKTEQIYNEIYN